MKAYLGIDLGGTTCSIGVYPTLRSPKQRDVKIFNWQGDYTVDFPDMLGAIGDLAEQYQLQGVGIGTAGSVDPASGRIIASSYQHSWDNQPLVSEIRKRFKVPVRLGNDSEAAALAEALYGHGKDDSFWFVIWGTGIGASYVHRAARGFEVIPSELGHAVVDPSGPECLGCGVHGCTESLAGGRSIEHYAGVHPKDLPEKEWRKIEAAMGRFAYNLFRAHATEMIVFGGGVADKQSQRIPQIATQSKQYFNYLKPPAMKGSALGEQGGLLGGLALLQQPA